jgi:2-(1,2-epoxy-1,2-dihydrophenyl)acetyl-CoA isomerase
MSEDSVHFERDGTLGVITLARPNRSNAFDIASAHAFGAALDSASDSGVRAVLLRGEGKRFCAGGDVVSMARAEDRSAYMLELATLLDSQLRRLSELDKPVVAEVHGAVAGAGLAFVLNADVVVAAQSTKFVMAYSGVGLTPDCGVSYLLPRVVGQQRALEMALTGRVLGAAEARDWGLVAEVVDDAALRQRGTERAAALAAEPVFALVQAKRLIRSSWLVTREESARDEAQTISRAVLTADAVSRIDRFAE